MVHWSQAMPRTVIPDPEQPHSGLLGGASSSPLRPYCHPPNNGTRNPSAAGDDRKVGAPIGSFHVIRTMMGKRFINHLRRRQTGRL